MTLTIHKGKHRPRFWWLQLRIWHNKKSISRKVTFGSNCNYDLPGDADDLDVNKLFGLGYFWNKKESARFGWNYNKLTNKIDLFAYYHLNGVMNFKKICDVFMGSEYLMILNIYDGNYSFAAWSVNDGLPVGDTLIEKPHAKKWSYALGCYLGGNKTLDHDITIEIKKV